MIVIKNSTLVHIKLVKSRDKEEFWVSTINECFLNVSYSINLYIYQTQNISKLDWIYKNSTIKVKTFLDQSGSIRLRKNYNSNITQPKDFELEIFYLYPPGKMHFFWKRCRGTNFDVHISD